MIQRKKNLKSKIRKVTFYEYMSYFIIDNLILNLKVTLINHNNNFKLNNDHLMPWLVISNPQTISFVL